MDYAFLFTMYLVEAFLQHPIAFLLWATALYFTFKPR